MNILANIARVASATTGTGALTLGSAATGGLTFAQAGVANGDVVSYAIEDYDASGAITAREVGAGTYSSAGPTLARTTIYNSSNGGAAIDCSGRQYVLITALKEDFTSLAAALAATSSLAGAAFALASDGADDPMPIPGPKGADGTSGATGAQGPAGPALYFLAEDGQEGERGATGLTGAQGSQGERGPPGVDGDPGEDGIMGPPGLRGADGATGAQGPMGPALWFLAEDGVDGDRGPPGATGATGAPGGGGGGSATTVEVNLGSAPNAYFQGKFTITDAAISPTSKVLCWQAPGPYTGKGTRADEADAAPVSVIAVEPGTGSAVVKWQTPPMVVMNSLPTAGGQPASAIVPGLKDLQAIGLRPAKRIGRVRGNVKFSYTVFA